MNSTPAAPPEGTPQEIADAIARLAATPNGPAALDLLHRHQHLSAGEGLAIAASWSLRGGGPVAPVAEKAANAVRDAVDPGTWADFEAVSRHLRLDHRARLDEHHETLTSKVESAAFWAAAARLAAPGGPPAAIALLEAMFTAPLQPNVDERRPTVARTLDWAAARVADANDAAYDDVDGVEVPVLSAGHLERVRRWLAAEADTAPWILPGIRESARYPGAMPALAASRTKKGWTLSLARVAKGTGGTPREAAAALVTNTREVVASWPTPDGLSRGGRDHLQEWLSTHQDALLVDTLVDALNLTDDECA